MDFEDFLDRIDLHHKQSLPFVAYQKPNTDQVKAFLQNDATLYSVNDYTESGFVMAPFDRMEKAVLIPLKQSETLAVIDKSNLRFPVQTDKPLGSAKLIHIQKSIVSTILDENAKALHIQLVKKGIQTIEKGDLRKVVLSRKESQTVKEANPLDIFKRLLASYPSAFVYCFYHPKVGTWLGATPETLLKVDGHRFYTTALAATQPFRGIMDVTWNAKEKEEHGIVTKFIVDRLKDSTSHLNVSSTESVKAGSLLHLKANISGTLNNQQLDIQQILNTLHPTPAVCGVPKEEAKEFIIANENYNREFYTGFLGELNLKERKMRSGNRHNAENDAFSIPISVSNLFVNLRCMQLKLDKAIIYVGGGITKDSDPEAEWEETVNKTQTIKSVL